MKKNKNLLFLFVLMFVGCSSGPMKKVQGPYETPVFSAIAKDLVKDGSENILYKEWSKMYEKGNLLSSGVFFVTEKGVYMAFWDAENYRYRLTYRALVANIDSLSEKGFKKDDKNELLFIKSNFGLETGFALEGRRAVRSILNGLMQNLNQE